MKEVCVCRKTSIYSGSERERDTTEFVSFVSVDGCTLFS
jgi:hypothetical protein